MKAADGVSVFAESTIIARFAVFGNDFDETSAHGCGKFNVHTVPTNRFKHIVLRYHGLYFAIFAVFHVFGVIIVVCCDVFGSIPVANGLFILTFADFVIGK